MHRTAVIITILFATALFAVSAQADQLVQDDQIIDGSACIGMDCVNGENFNFDTIRLKENNLRIGFVDTSGTSSFPSNDWEITVNDSANGGLNHFSITDIDGGKNAILRLEAGAPASSLHVGNSGKVGFGTNSPLTELHSVTGNTPTVRLEQDGSSGFAPQSWDMGGNETNFFIRDVTNGSTLPLRIMPGTPNSMLHACPQGLGVNNANPNAALHVKTMGSSSFALILDAGNDISTGTQYKTLNATIDIQAQGTVLGYASNGAGEASISLNTENGDLTASGIITALQVNSISSRSTKENVVAADVGSVLNKVVSLAINTWSYIDDESKTPHIGPMAEDFFAAFALGSSDRHLSLADVAGVALAAIQGLAQRQSKQAAALETLRTENARLLAQNAGLEARLSVLEAKPSSDAALMSLKQENQRLATQNDGLEARLGRLEHLLTASN